MTDQPTPPTATTSTDGDAPPSPSDTAAATPTSPRKWLGRYGGWIVFAVFALLWAYLLLLQLLVWHYRSELPLILGLGSFAIAGLFLYQMCYRLTPADSIRPRFLLLVFVFGGLAAYAASRAIEPLFQVAIGGSPDSPPLAYTWLAVPTEELCKIIVVIVIARWVAVKNARVGLLIGGAVGFGFAAYENFEKAFATLINAGGGLPTTDLKFVPAHQLFPHIASTLALNTGIRELLTPFAHPIWTGLLAAAIFAAYRGNRLRVTPAVVITFVVVVVVHVLWDFLPQVFNLIFVDDQGEALILAYVVYAVLGIAGAIVWNVVRIRTNRSAVAPMTLPEPGQVVAP